jgi:fructose-1,6-bisphosphatase/inositol monophosphatase family enzyme
MDEEFKILAKEIVKKTERKIRATIKNEPYRLGKTIDIGADGTPTKYIDRVAEDVAILTINNAKIPVNLLTEESGFIDNGGDYIFVLDPIDGTRNATRGIPFFTISLAIGKNKLSDIQYGIIKNISNKDEFIVEKNLGAFLNKKRVIIPDIPASDLVYDITFSKLCNDKSFFLSHQTAIRSLGCASLEMCMVGTGAFDAYIVGEDYMRITDIAASALFVREAGGIVANIYGKNLQMPLDLAVRTSIITACNNQIITSIAENLNK